MKGFFKSIYFFSLLLCATTFFAQNFVLIARPGSGKGTFANYMAKKHHYIHIGLGDLYRQRHDNNLPVTGRILTKILKKRMELAIQNNQKFILDNVISSLDDWKVWKSFLKKNNITNDICFLILEASQQTCKNRMKQRVICRKCFGVYQQSPELSLKNYKCPECANSLSIRSQDRIDKFVLQRFINYDQKTIPLIQEIEKLGQFKVIKISSEKKLEELYEIYDKLNNL
jgi:adenylate kinase family enzyme